MSPSLGQLESPQSSQSSQAVVLLSGGLDSAVSLAKILADAPGCVAVCLTFDYGQRARQQEIAASQALCQHYGVDHQVVHLPWLSQMLPPALAPVREGQSLFESSPDTPVEKLWVPNRNGVLLNIAAAWAESKQAQRVVFGANLEEAQAGFPDNTLAYRDRLNQALAMSTLTGVRVETPVGHLTKTAIVSLGASLRLPFSLLWSCYEAGALHCGRCTSCGFLKRGLAEQQQEQAVPFAHSC
ncbi:MAG: 7-cyano-7-deazaguanine synthase QueC [Candidatus Melainabacteria bacterium]|nr:7-cyano-7-deazaguanine synthase QueC [Candidatus Melainabacteria bacterium]